MIVTGGTASLEIDGTAVFENGSATTLTGDLRLDNPVTVVQAGATFSGGGTLINAAGSHAATSGRRECRRADREPRDSRIGASPGQSAGPRLPAGLRSAILKIELAGTDLNDFDRLTLTGQAQLAGALNVSLLDGFSPSLGNAFTFISAVGGISGTFDTTDLPDLATGLFWSITYNPTNVQLIVVPGIAGDYNQDGTVDAADYVMWRKIDGTQDGYDAWQANFGETAGGGSAEGGTVPEPANALPLLFAIAVKFISRSRRKPVSQLVGV